MSLGAETILVGAIGAAALAWAIRGLWRALRSRGACSTCGSADECPLAGGKEPLQELKPRDDGSR